MVKLLGSGLQPCVLSHEQILSGQLKICIQGLYAQIKVLGGSIQQKTMGYNYSLMDFLKEQPFGKLLSGVGVTTSLKSKTKRCTL